MSVSIEHIDGAVAGRGLLANLRAEPGPIPRLVVQIEPRGELVVEPLSRLRLVQHGAHTATEIHAEGPDQWIVIYFEEAIVPGLLDGFP